MSDQNPFCPLCGSGRVEIYWNHVWTAPGKKVCCCGNCSLFFIHPPLTAQEEQSYYKDYSCHLQRRAVEGSKTVEETFLKRSESGQYRIDILKDYLLDASSILEIGGGCGNFIADIRKAGFGGEAVLVELCWEHLEFAIKKLGIKGFSALEDLKSGPFSAICMFHVLEHILEPVPFLNKCRDLLDEGGCLVIEVPSSSDPLLSIYDCDSYKDFYFQPMHHYVYSEKTLGVLAGLAGFSISKFIPIQRYPLSNHLHWLRSGRAGTENKYTEIVGKKLDDEYRKKMVENNTTDTIFCILRK